MTIPDMTSATKDTTIGRAGKSGRAPQDHRKPQEAARLEEAATIAELVRAPARRVSRTAGQAGTAASPVHDLADRGIGRLHLRACPDTTAALGSKDPVCGRPPHRMLEYGHLSVRRRANRMRRDTAVAADPRGCDR